MNLMDGLLLAIDCSEQAEINIMSIIGYVVWGIKVAVPIILIIVGMVELGSAVAKKGEDEVKKAQKSLVSKAAMAVVIFLIPTIVSLLMGVLSADDWKQCWKCVSHPGSVNPGEYDCRINTDVSPNTEKTTDDGQQQQS